MRSLRQVERDITEAEAVVNNPGEVGPTIDNDGNLISTAEDRVAAFSRRLARLQQERAALLRILGRGNGDGSADQLAERAMDIIDRAVAEGRLPG
jgi:hypothetical protein